MGRLGLRCGQTIQWLGMLRLLCLLCAKAIDHSWSGQVTWRLTTESQEASLWPGMGVVVQETSGMLLAHQVSTQHAGCRLSHVQSLK